MSNARADDRDWQRPPAQHPHFIGDGRHPQQQQQTSDYRSESQWQQQQHRAAYNGDGEQQQQQQPVHFDNYQQQRYQPPHRRGHDINQQQQQHYHQQPPFLQQPPYHQQQQQYPKQQQQQPYQQRQQHYQQPYPFQPHPHSHPLLPPPPSQQQTQYGQHQQWHPSHFASPQPVHWQQAAPIQRVQRSSSKKKKGVRIPDNWVDVPTIGSVIRDSRFVAMRCPLDAKFAHLHASPDDVWSPQLFLREQAQRGLNVGLVIDLTNTTKYYDGATELSDSGVAYAKLPIEGFRAPPSARDVAQFAAVVDAFVATAPLAQTIAVHCTHGLNRTGYLIVHYLVTTRKCSVAHALESFALARPPGLLKHMYVEALYRDLGAGEEVTLPELPGWAVEKYSKQRR